MFSEARIKHEARLAISKNRSWGKAIAITIITICMYSLLYSFKIVLDVIIDGNIFSHTAFEIYFDPYFYTQIINDFSFHIFSFFFVIFIFSILFIIFIIWPFSLGKTYWMYEVANGSAPSVFSIFRYFKSKELYVKAINFKFHLFLRCFLRLAICLSPAVITFFILSELALFSNDMLYNDFLFFWVAILAVLGVFVYLVSIIRYFLAPYFFVLNDENKILDCIENSCVGMRGKYFRVIKLFVIFIPWFILSFFILPIFYVYPYTQVSFALSAKWIIYEMVEEREASIY